MEVKYNGQWGTVCHHGWDSNDTYVVCRQLGFGTDGSYYYNAYFGQGTGPIWLHFVTCIGSESTLARCGHLGINIASNTLPCRHSQDIGVRCYGSPGKAFWLACCPFMHAN